MKANGDGTTSLDLTRIPVLAQYLNNTGVHWIFSAGSTGESVDLTVAERKAMAEAWVNVAKGYPKMRVIVHVGADSVVDARDMAAHAQSIGADCIAAMPPTYLKPYWGRVRDLTRRRETWATGGHVA